MLSRRKFLIGASSAAAAVAVGPSLPTREGASYFTGCAIDARMKQGAAEYYYAIVHPDTLRALKRLRPDIVEQLRKSRSILLESHPIEIKGVRFIE